MIYKIYKFIVYYVNIYKIRGFLRYTVELVFLDFSSKQTEFTVNLILFSI